MSRALVVHVVNAILCINLQDFFAPDAPLPQIAGPLYVKVEGKKAWKKHYCVLRPDAIYYNPKGSKQVRKLTLQVRARARACLYC